MNRVKTVQGHGRGHTSWTGRKRWKIRKEGVVKVKWARVNKGAPYAPEITWRLVADDLEFGERVGELFEGAPLWLQ